MQFYHNMWCVYLPIARNTLTCIFRNNIYELETRRDTLISHIMECFVVQNWHTFYPMPLLKVKEIHYITYVLCALFLKFSCHLKCICMQKFWCKHAAHIRYCHIVLWLLYTFGWMEWYSTGSHTTSVVPFGAVRCRAVQSGSQHKF